MNCKHFKIKNIIKFLFSILIIFCYISCDTNDNHIELNITKSEWSTEVIENFGFVYLDIEGDTNAEMVTVRTYGDGVIFDCELNLDNEGCFQDTINISFIHNPITYSFTASTIIRAYKNTKIKEIILESGELSFY